MNGIGFESWCATVLFCKLGLGLDLKGIGESRLKTSNSSVWWAMDFIVAELYLRDQYRDTGRPPTRWICLNRLDTCLHWGHGRGSTVLSRYQRRDRKCGTAPLCICLLRQSGNPATETHWDQAPCAHWSEQTGSKRGHKGLCDWAIKRLI